MSLHVWVAAVCDSTCAHPHESKLHLPRSAEIWQKPWTSLHSNQVPQHHSRCVWRSSMFEFACYKWFSLECISRAEIKVVHLCWDKQVTEEGIINCICSFLSQLRTVLFWIIHIYSRDCLHLKWKCSTLLTFKSHINFWWILSIQNSIKIYALKGSFSIFPCLGPLILQVLELDSFLNNLSIKLGEYNNQRHCDFLISIL